MGTPQAARDATLRALVLEKQLNIHPSAASVSGSCSSSVAIHASNDTVKANKLQEEEQEQAQRSRTMPTKRWAMALGQHLWLTALLWRQDLASCFREPVAQRMFCELRTRK